MEMFTLRVREKLFKGDYFPLGMPGHPHGKVLRCYSVPEGGFVAMVTSTGDIRCDAPIAKPIQKPIEKVKHQKKVKGYGYARLRVLLDGRTGIVPIVDMTSAYRKSTDYQIVEITDKAITLKQMDKGIVIIVDDLPTN